MDEAGGGKIPHGAFDRVGQREVPQLAGDLSL
jgi:hypothetical protein